VSRFRAALRRRWRRDDGMLGAEALFGGVLVIIIGTLITIGLWAVLDARLAANDAARAGTRAYVEAQGRDGANRARTAATEVLAAHGKAGSGTVSVNRARSRCEGVTVSVSIEVSWLPVRFLGGASTMTVEATDSEVLDPYRSQRGQQGIARCS
jgi:hypothetical protein